VPVATTIAVSATPVRLAAYFYSSLPPMGPPAGSGNSFDDPEIGVGLFLRSIAPQHAAPQPYVFSFYARTDRPEPVEVQLKAFGHTLPRVKIAGAQWARYHVPLEVPARADSHSWLLVYAGGPVELDALQFEQGSEPTEFQP